MQMDENCEINRSKPLGADRDWILDIRADVTRFLFAHCVLRDSQITDDGAPG